MFLPIREPEQWRRSPAFKGRLVTPGQQRTTEETQRTPVRLLTSRDLQAELGVNLEGGAVHSPGNPISVTAISVAAAPPFQSLQDLCRSTDGVRPSTGVHNLPRGFTTSQGGSRPPTGVHDLLRGFTDAVPLMRGTSGPASTPAKSMREVTVSTSAQGCLCSAAPWRAG